MSGYEQEEAKEVLTRHAGKLGDYAAEREAAAEAIVDELVGLSGHCDWQFDKLKSREIGVHVRFTAVTPPRVGQIKWAQGKGWTASVTAGMDEQIQLDFNPLTGMFVGPEQNPEGAPRSPLAILVAAFAETVEEAAAAHKRLPG